jgi:hypothetical protein
MEPLLKNFDGDELTKEDFIKNVRYVLNNSIGIHLYEKSLLTNDIDELKLRLNCKSMSTAV